MARKKIREYDGKQLLKQNLSSFCQKLRVELHAVQVVPETNWDELVKAHSWLSQVKLVVKPDMLFGQRGKSGFVGLNLSLEEAKTFIAERMGKPVTVKNITDNVVAFIVEPFVPHSEEYYLSFGSTRSSTRIMFSPAGGVEIEENWDLVRTFDILAGNENQPLALPDTFLADVPASVVPTLTGFIAAALAVFVRCDATTIEFNPLTIIPASSHPVLSGSICSPAVSSAGALGSGLRAIGSTAILPEDDVVDEALVVVPLDIRVELDDQAALRNLHTWPIDSADFPSPFGSGSRPAAEGVIEALDAKTGASLKLTVLNPKGRIWSLVAGGGASVIYADTVADLGAGDMLGNYGEYSGNPTDEHTYTYAMEVLKLACSDPEDKSRFGRALLVGGGIANFTDVAATFRGIIRALMEMAPALRECGFEIWVRRAGPNYEKALRMFQDVQPSLGVGVHIFGPDVVMTSIIHQAVTALKSRDSQ